MDFARTVILPNAADGMRAGVSFMIENTQQAASKVDMSVVKGMSTLSLPHHNLLTSLGGLTTAGSAIVAGGSYVAGKVDMNAVKGSFIISARPCHSADSNYISFQVDFSRLAMPSYREEVTLPKK